jgi:tetratricopeptide (TPR) repeat protein
MCTGNLKQTINPLLLACCFMLFTSLANAQFSVSERTFKKLNQVEKLMEQKEFNAAAAILESLESSSASRKYELALVYQAFGFLYHETNRHQKAIDYFEKSLTLNASPEPVLQNIRLNLVQLYAIANDYHKATQYFAAWIKQEPTPSGDRLALGGSLYAHIKQYDTAIAYLKQAIATAKPAKESWYRTLLSVYYQREDYHSASELLQELVALYPDNKEYWMQLFSGFYLINDYQKALSTLELAYNNNMLDNEEQIANLAKLYIYLGTPIKAAKLLSHEIDNSRLKKTEQNLRLLADAYLHSQEVMRSAQTYVQLAKLTSNPELYLQAAQLYMEAKEWNQVVDSLDKAGTALNQGQAYILKGMALVELNELDKAVEAFRDAQQRADTRASANRWLEYIDTQKQIASR